MNPNPLKVALIGLGKMGALIEELANKRGDLIVARVDAEKGFDPLEQLSGIDIDVCIDFSDPACALEHVQFAAKHSLNLVMGTTGWEADLESARQTVLSSQIGFLYAPNFSIGVNLFYKIVEEAAALINPHHIYDVAANEVHHTEKKDIPSGTAKALAEKLLIKFDRKKSAVFSLPNGSLKDEELHVSSSRCGNTPGVHTVTFDSPYDTITLTHTARNRTGFAQGALRAAEWLKGKQGFYTMEDLL